MAALDVARVRDGDEGAPSVDNAPDWLRIRTTGPFAGNGNGYGFDGLGVLGYGYDSVNFGNGAAY